MSSVYDNTKVQISLTPATRTASANGTGVDTMGYTDGMAVIAGGDLDLASGNETYAFSIEDSADNSSFAAVSGLTTTLTADDTTKVIRLAGIGTSLRRYIRVVATLGGTTPSWPGTALIELGGAYNNPVN